MKTTLLLIALLGFTAMAPAADKKPERKPRNEKKDDKKDDKKKEEERNQFEVTVEGAKDEAAEADVKIFLSSIEGVRLEKSEKTEKGIEAVLSTGGAMKLSRGDIAKALKDNKDLKVSDFKAVRPGRDKDMKKDEKKTDRKDDKKPDEKKPEEKKPTEVKPGDTKPVDPKPAGTKPAETKPAETKPAEMKPAETKPAEMKPAETKPAETKAA